MRYTFASTFEDGSPRLFVGTWRPPFSEYLKAKLDAQPWLLPYGDGRIRDSWTRGDGDRALYAAEDDA